MQLEYSLELYEKWTLSKVLCWRRTIPLVIPRRPFVLECLSLFILNLQSFLVQLKLTLFKRGALLCSFIQWVKAVDSFRKKLDLRCLTAFLIRLYISLHSGWGTYSLEVLALTVTQSNKRTNNGIHGCYKSQSLILKSIAFCKCGSFEK